ncbi:MAG: hypothetical protein J7J92_01180 [Candidatus Aenigmarchaeota archaeon]|nr:hypothetical protein [Candidatus Aenigmarchaeota archaeon]
MWTYIRTLGRWDEINRKCDRIEKLKYLDGGHTEVYIEELIPENPNFKIERRYIRDNHDMSGIRLTEYYDKDEELTKIEYQVPDYYELVELEKNKFIGKYFFNSRFPLAISHGSAKIIRPKKEANKWLEHKRKSMYKKYTTPEEAKIELIKAGLL